MRAGAQRLTWPRRLDLRRIVTYDLPLKLTALLIAVLFWLASVQNASPRDIVVPFDGRVPVEKPAVPNGYVLRGNLGDVAVTLRGPEGVVDRLSVASNGRMIGGLDEERLRRVLLSLLRSRIQPLPFRSKAS